jgi:hypothetical protein
MQVVHPRSRLCIPDANSASQRHIVHPRCKLCRSSFSFAFLMAPRSFPSVCIAKTIPLHTSVFSFDRVLSQRTLQQQYVDLLESLKLKSRIGNPCA